MHISNPIFLKALDLYRPLLEASADIPNRSSLTPQYLLPILPHVGLVELVDDHTCIATLTGTMVDAYLEESITGANLYDFCEAKLHPIFRSLFNYCHAHKCGGIVQMELKLGEKSVPNYNVLYLPLLATKAGGAPLLLTVTYTDKDTSDLIVQVPTGIYPIVSTVIQAYSFDLKNSEIIFDHTALVA